MKAMNCVSEMESPANDADSDSDSQRNFRSASRQLHKRISPVTELSVIAEDAMERAATANVVQPSFPTLSPNSAINSSLSAVSYDSLYSTQTIETPEQEENLEAEQQPEPEPQRREEAPPRNLAEEACAADDVRKLLHDCTAQGDFALLEYVLNNLSRVHRSITTRTGGKTRVPNPTVSEVLNSKHYGDTLLTTAIKNDREAIAKWLVLRGAKTNIICPTYDYYEETTKKKVQVSPVKKTAAKKKAAPAKLKRQVVKSTKECVDYYEMDVRQLAYIHELYDFVDFLDKYREKYGD